MSLLTFFGVNPSLILTPSEMTQVRSYCSIITPEPLAVFIVTLKSPLVLFCTNQDLAGEAGSKTLILLVMIPVNIIMPKEASAVDSVTFDPPAMDFDKNNKDDISTESPTADPAARPVSLNDAIGILAVGELEPSLCKLLAITEFIAVVVNAVASSPLPPGLTDTILLLFAAIIGSFAMPTSMAANSDRNGADESDAPVDGDPVAV